MNGFVGYPKNDSSPVPRTPLKFFGKTTDFFNPGGIFVFIDEHADSICSGNFWTIDVRIPDWNYWGEISEFLYVADLSEPTPDDPDAELSLPASYHNRASGISFADGHAEVHRWVDAPTMQPVKPVFLPAGFVPPERPPSPPNVPFLEYKSSPHDFLWLTTRSTYPAN